MADLNAIMAIALDGLLGYAGLHWQMAKGLRLGKHSTECECPYIHYLPAAVQLCPKVCFSSGFSSSEVSTRPADLKP